jgi:hypothetical protein
LVLSADFSVEGSSAQEIHSVSYGQTVDLALLSLAFHTVDWRISSTSHEDDVAPTITYSGAPNGATASFPMVADPGDGEGRSVIVQCTVTDQRGTTATATRKVSVANDRGYYPLCVDETLEASATHGWVPQFNSLLNIDAPPYLDVRSYGTWTPDSAAAGLTNAATLVAAKAAAAAASVALVGGIAILIPGGTYYLRSDSVASNEGTVCEFEAGDDNITIRGAGRGLTILKPTSNKIEIFLQNGADNITIEDLSFDNDTRLTEQTDSGAIVAGDVAGGVAGYGNGANCPIRQVRGAGTTARRVHFEGFDTCVHHVGDVDDQAVLDGTVTIEDCTFDDYCFGLLAHQPEHIRMLGDNRSSNCVASVDDVAAEKPGHMLYVTNRDGAHPKSVYVESAYGENDHSSVIKIRKGETVEFGRIVSYLNGRGPEIWGAKRITGGSVNTVLAETDAGDTNASGLELTDCGPAEIDNVFVDVNGVNAWGVRVRADDPYAWSNTNIRLANVTVKSANAGTTGKAAIILEDQTDFSLDNFRFLHSGSTAATRYPVDVRDCTRARINRPSHFAPDGPSDAENLVSFDVDCVDCSVAYSGQDLSTSATGDTISDLGTNTSIVRTDSALANHWGAGEFTTYGKIGRIEIVEHFIQSGDALTGLTVSVSGAGAAGTVSCDTGRFGVLDCATGTDTTGRAGVQSGTAGILFGGGRYRLRIDAQLVDASDGSETYIARLGFLDSVSAEPTDGVFFRYTHSVNSGNWVCVTRSNGSETPTNTAVSLSAGNYRTFEIEINAAGTSAAFYIDGVLVHTETLTIPVGASRNTGYGAALIKSAGSTSRSMRLDLLGVSFEPTAPL